LRQSLSQRPADSADHFLPFRSVTWLSSIISRGIIAGFHVELCRTLPGGENCEKPWRRGSWRRKTGNRERPRAATEGARLADQSLLRFMCVIPFEGGEFNRDMSKTEGGVLTHRQAKSSLSFEDTSSSLVQEPKETACPLAPAACHRGVSFLNSIHPEQPVVRLHCV